MDELNRLLASYLYQYSLVIWQAFKFSWLGGLIAGLSLVMRIDWGTRRLVWRTKLAWWAFLLCVFAWGGGYFIFNFGLAGKYVAGIIPTNKIIQFLCFSIVGVAIGLVALRKLEGTFEQLTQRFTKKSRLERNTKTDIRHIKDFLPERKKGFSPPDFFNSKKGIFFGLDEHGKPIFVPNEVWAESHVMLCGMTRSGKGVAAQTLLVQALLRGEFVVVLDPKGDKHLPIVLSEAAKKCGVRYEYLDLNPGTSAQMNIFMNMSSPELKEALIGAFALGETGRPDDHYRKYDREAASCTAKAIDTNPDLTPRQALSVLDEETRNKADGFVATLREIADLDSVNSSHGGIDLEGMAAAGGVLYVYGSMTNPQVLKMQRFILIRLMQMARKNSRYMAKSRPICVLADEFRYHLSLPAFQTLGAAAGWGMKIIAAFQALGDLSQVTSDLDAQAVRSGTIENCNLRLTYRINDSETAKWLADNTGTILVDEETRKVDRNTALAEKVRFDGRILRQSERNYIDQNMFLSLPKGCGVLFASGKLPRFCYTSPVKIRESSLEAISPTTTSPIIEVPSPI